MAVSLSWAGGSTRRWRKLRASILAANALTNGGRCTLAIPRVCSGMADQVHHALGKAVTGDDPRFLQATCGPCNRKVGEPGARVEPRRVSSW
jgi:hypothetical protein